MWYLDELAMGWRCRGPASMPKPRQTLATLQARTTRLENGCLQWDGFITSDGYGAAGYRGHRHFLVHRAFYVEQVGEIPEGMTVDHECHNRDATCRGGPTCPHRCCVEVTHLKPKDRVDNSQASPNAMGKRTHCPHGHEYSKENTAIYDGRRFCIACSRIRARAQAKRRKEARP